MHGVDADLGVPVVGRADDHGVDVLAVEELAVVFVDVGLFLADALVVLGFFGVAAVDVADGQEIAVVHGAASIARALAAGADQAEPRPVVLGPRLVGQGAAEGRKEGEERGARRRDAKEFPAVVRADIHQWWTLEQEL